jgi:hypothetical protein
MTESMQNSEIELSSGLTHIQQQAIIHLMSSKSIEQAAKMTGCSSRSIHRWLAEDGPFIAELSRVQSNLMKQANIRLIGLQSDVLDRLSELLNSKDEVIALKSADILAGFILKFYEISQVANRLQLLEETMRGDNDA